MHDAGRSNFDAKVLDVHSALERALFTRTTTRQGAPGGVESGPQKFPCEVTFQSKIAHVWSVSSVSGRQRVSPPAQSGRAAHVPAKRARAHYRAYLENVHAGQAGGPYTGVCPLASVSDLTGSRALAGGIGAGHPDH